MNKAKAISVRAELTKTLEKLGKELNMTFNLGNGKFNANEFSLKLTCVDNDEGGSPKIIGLESLKAELKRRGVSDVTKSFKLPGYIGTFKIDEYRERNSRYPVIVQDLHGTRIKVSLDAVALYLAQ